MNNVLIGCKCAFWIAMTFVAIEGMTLIRNLDARTEQAATGAYHLTETTAQTEATQNVYWKKAATEVDIILGTVRHQLDPKYEGGLAMTVGNLNKSAIEFTNVLTNAKTLLADTNTSLNDKDKGVLIALGVTLIAVKNQVNALGADNGPIDSSSKAMQSLAKLLADPNLPATLKNIETGTSAFSNAGEKVDSILFDLQHPERPGKFVRAVGIMLNILGATSKMGQSAPVFGR